MGFDTRYWGPSAWQLFHLIAFFSPHPQEFLLSIKDILPCKFCRESTAEFVGKMPVCENPGQWMYDLHNMVNHKLRTQAKDDPSVIDPGPDPSFEEVKLRYEQMKPNAVPGRDFLFVVAANYEPENRVTHEAFWKRLADVYPFEEFREIVQKYGAPDLKSRSSYMKWTYGLLTKLSKKARAPILTFNGYSQQVAFYKSGCDKKTYRGKTCRKLAGGGRTKKRDHKKTRRVAYSSLLR